MIPLPDYPLAVALGTLLWQNPIAERLERFVAWLAKRMAAHEARKAGR